MIKLFTGNTTRGATSAVIDEIKRNYAIGVNQIILTPDSYKFTIEKEIFNALELEGSFDIEVTTFARLAQSILKHKAKKCLSKEGAVLLLRNVIARNKDKLLHYGAVANNPRFAHEIFAVIASIRNNGYTANDLEKILPNLAKGTRTKTHDFALLFREYENALVGKYADATYMVDALIEKIPDSKTIKDSYVYAIAYDKFTGQQLKVLELIAKNCRSLSVGVTPNNRGANAHLYPWETSEAIKAMPVKVKEMDYVFERVKEPFATLNKRMFSYTQIPNKVSCDGRINISRENNVFEEFNGIAHEIARLVRREGVRFNEISIINLNPDYNNELSSILDRYEIPHFVSLKYSLGNTIIAKFIKEYFDVIVFNKRVDKVIQFMKDPIFGGDTDDVCEFENYVMAHNVNFDGFNLPIEGEEYANIEKLRTRLMEYIDKFPEEKGSVKDKLTVIYDVVKDENLEATIREALDNAPDNVVESNVTAIKRAKEIIEETITLIGEEDFSTEELEKSLFAAFTAEEVSLIPLSLDAVYVGGLRESYVPYQKAIFVCSATGDVFPSQSNYSAIISPQDEEMLLKNSIRLYPMPHDRINEGEFSMLDLITRTDKLYVSSAQFSPIGEELPSSILIKEIENFVEVKEDRLSGKFILDKATTKEEIEDVIVSRKNAEWTYLSVVNKPLPKGGELMAQQARDTLYSSLDKDSRARIERVINGKASSELVADTEGYFKKENGNPYTSVSQLEAYFKCPFRHYVQYGLRAKERKVGKLAPVDFGTIIHDVLYEYFKRVKNTIDTLSDVEIKEQIEVAVQVVFSKDEYKRYTASATNLTEINALKDECRKVAVKLTENLLKGEFRPRFLEENINDNSRIPTIRLNTEMGELFIKGKIDRIDVDKENNAYVLDYKTGSKTSTRDDIYYGVNLQLFVYLSSVKNAGYRPVGAFLLPIKSGYSRDGFNLKMVGQILNDVNLLEKLEKGFLAREERQSGTKTDSEVIEFSVKSNKKAELNFTSRTNCFDDAGFDYIFGYVKRVMENAVNEILAGNREKKPLNKCEDCCYYGVVCSGVDEENSRVKNSKALPFGNNINNAGK